jgi:hypothetical protein
MIRKEEKKKKVDSISTCISLKNKKQTQTAILGITVPK